MNTTIMMTITTRITIVVTTMTERAQRTKPAVAAKVIVTGASLTSVLAMTAAMGSAAENSSDDVGDEATFADATVDSATTDSMSSTTELPRDTTIVVLMADGQLVPLPPDLFAEVPPTAPVVGQVVAGQVSAATGTTITSAPMASSPVPTAPVVAPAPAPSVSPTPIIVQVPTPAPAPSASTNKSR
jgi:hypothetical protein